MNKELKKAIFIYLCDNLSEFQIIQKAREEFRPYIFASKGDYLIGGKEVLEFIRDTEKLIKNY